MTDWVGDPGRRVDYGVRFTRPVVVPDDDAGATIEVTGKVSRKDEDGIAQVTLTVRLRGRHGAGQGPGARPPRLTDRLTGRLGWRPWRPLRPSPSAPRCASAGQPTSGSSPDPAPSSSMPSSPRTPQARRSSCWAGAATSWSPMPASPAPWSRSPPAGSRSHVVGDVVHLAVAAGEPWDAVVAHAVANGWSGIEALSGIPGRVGATPIQNVGAYGQDVSQTVASVRVLDRADGEVRTLEGADCGFGYRMSRFKADVGQMGRAVGDPAPVDRPPRGGPLRGARPRARSVGGRPGAGRGDPGRRPRRCGRARGWSSTTPTPTPGARAPSSPTRSSTTPSPCGSRTNARAIRRRSGRS